MKKNIKLIALIYIGVVVVTYAVTLRVEKLNSIEDTDYQNKTIVLKLK